MQIAVVTTSWPEHDGDPAGHFVRTHARQLEGDGHAVIVVSPPPGGAFGWPGVAARVRARPWRALDAARWVVAARQRVAGLDLDRVIAHWSVPCAYPIGMAAPASLEVVSHGGDVRLLRSLPARARHRIVDALTRRATCWAFASEPLRAELARALDRPGRAALERIACVRAPPIDLPDADEIRASVAACRRAVAGASFAVCVGRLVPSKRVDRVIAHVAADAARTTLVVVGDGPERERLERLARALRADVRFVGAVSRLDALGWIAAADVILHASEAEGLSTVLREARWLGTAILELAPRDAAGNTETEA